VTTTHYQTGLKTKKRLVLERGVKQLGLSCSDEQIDQLLTYLEMLDRWNQAYNLTAIKDPLEMIGLHLLDSLAVSPMLSGESCIDVGTGAGLPGIPLAIMNPKKKFTLLDSNGKKTRFLFQAKIELKLSNIQEVNTRVEKYLPEHGYDHVLSRAFSSLSDMVSYCDHLLTIGGSFLALKGRIDKTELSDIPKSYMVEEIHPLNVPGVDGARHLIKIVRH